MMVQFFWVSGRVRSSADAILSEKRLHPSQFSELIPRCCELKSSMKVEGRGSLREWINRL